jgi:Asp-tRNA(Asn)/Glu-tRNA(Gln) amidotransferase A subunit family amidase
MLNSLPTIADARRAMVNREITSSALVEHCLRQIDRLESTVHAWVLVDADGARREAERLDKLAQQGHLVGPLHGIPVGIKDIIDVANMPTRAGSTLMAAHCAATDAPIVARLRAAGAILLGKTVTTEFACFDPSPTRNPWNLACTPGGSSSGSAVAVALEMCCAAIGSQTGGSITRPASFCGVAGMKPTAGWMPLQGVVPISSRLDHLGPLARTAGDLSAVYAALVADNASDENSTAGVLPLSAPQLGLIETYFMTTADAEVQAATRAAIDRLQAAGARFTPVELPASFEPVHAMHRCVMAVDLAETHCETFMQHAAEYGPKVAGLIREGLNTLAVEYALALRHYDGFRADMRRCFREGPIAVTPATVTPAPDADSTGDPSFNSPWSYAGLPTVNIPCGLSSGGMPCGLQFVGAPGSELQLLAVAAWCERVLQFPVADAITRLTQQIG